MKLIEVSQDAMQAMLASEPQPQPPILPEAAVMRLKERWAAFDRPPFKVGELVTPYPDAAFNGAGEPHLVITVDPNASWRWDGTPGTPAYGAIFDLRVLCLSHGDVAAYWCESWQFEPWSMPADPV